MTRAFLALPVIPTFEITDRGRVDGDRFDRAPSVPNDAEESTDIVTPDATASA
jgi:hypothetical protein